MKKLTVTVVLALSLVACVALAAATGKAAPPFTAASTQGEIALDDYAGKKHVVLAFYPKDFTGG